jgi:hypothetical protein
MNPLIHQLKQQKIGKSLLIMLCNAFLIKISHHGQQSTRISPKKGETRSSISVIPPSNSKKVCLIAISFVNGAFL